MPSRLVASLTCLAFQFLGPSAAEAQPEVIDRPVVIYVSTTAGGGLDLYARVVAGHLGKHIPGNPSITVQVMPGAGGIRAANFLAARAPRDGTAIAIFTGGPILEPLIGARDPGYNMSQFTWIGAETNDVSLCVAWSKSPFRTIQDAMKQQMIVGGTGAGSATDTWPIILNNVIGTKFKLVTGYPGFRETMLAIETGEVHGRCGLSVASLKSGAPDWLPQKKLNILLQIALEKSDEFGAVPSLLDLVTAEQDKRALELLIAPAVMARLVAAPPGLAPARAALIRRAYAATMKDPDFLAGVRKLGVDVLASSGEDVQRIIGRMYAAPKPVVDRVKNLLVP